MRSRDCARSALAKATVVAVLLIIASAAMVSTLPFIGRAAENAPDKNVVFGEAVPGHWKDLEALNIPAVIVVGGKVRITIPYPTSASHVISPSRSIAIFNDRPASAPGPANYTRSATANNTCSCRTSSRKPPLSGLGVETYQE
jgi:hypothetical protein